MSVTRAGLVGRLRHPGVAGRVRAVLEGWSVRLGLTTIMSALAVSGVWLSLLAAAGPVAWGAIGSVWGLAGWIAATAPAAALLLASAVRRWSRRRTRTAPNGRAST